MANKEIKKICPIMTAGNVNPAQSGIQGRPIQHEIDCLEELCGIWDEKRNRCGMIVAG
jgi:hypothetical protein